MTKADFLRTVWSKSLVYALAATEEEVTLLTDRGLTPCSAPHWYAPGIGDDKETTLRRRSQEGYDFPDLPRTNANPYSSAVTTFSCDISSTPLMPPFSRP